MPEDPQAISNAIKICARCADVTSKAGNYICKVSGRFRREMKMCPCKKWNL